MLISNDRRYRVIIGKKKKFVLTRLNVHKNNKKAPYFKLLFIFKSKQRKIEKILK
jgi:hypothetical protein